MARDLGLGDLHRTRCVARVLMGGYIPRDALHQPTGEPWGGKMNIERWMELKWYNMLGSCFQECPVGTWVIEILVPILMVDFS